MKLLTVLGARPQFIKAAVVSRVIREQYPAVQEDIIHTGQHYDYGMSQVFFDEMDIPQPTVNLHVGSGTHGAATADMLKGIEKEILARQPDAVLVYGDTNSTLAGALAAAKLHVPVAHIEAGERSFNQAMPEEMNRVLTDHISAVLYCCTEKSQSHLNREGITQNIHVVGDVMYDAFQYYLPRAIWPHALEKLSTPFVLMTLHRAQNTDDGARLRAIFAALAELSETIVLPLHPRTLKMLEVNQITLSSNIKLLQPVSYFEMLSLLQHCVYVITDSGGLQKEAYYAGKKCIVLREETEWVELVDAGINQLVGVEKHKILSASQWAKQATALPKGIYGHGNAGQKIMSHLAHRFLPERTAISVS